MVRQQGWLIPVDQYIQNQRRLNWTAIARIDVNLFTPAQCDREARAPGEYRWPDEAEPFTVLAPIKFYAGKN